MSSSRGTGLTSLLLGSMSASGKILKKINRGGYLILIYFSRADLEDLEVQLVQLNHCDGEYSNY